MFKVYKRKIYVWVKNPDSGAWDFAYATNAYPTCKSAVSGAKASTPDFHFKASFAKG